MGKTVLSSFGDLDIRPNARQHRLPRPDRLWWCQPTEARAKPIFRAITSAITDAIRLAGCGTVRLMSATTSSSSGGVSVSIPGQAGIRLDGGARQAEVRTQTR
jgi:hypothetical protein